MLNFFKLYFINACLVSFVLKLLALPAKYVLWVYVFILTDLYSIKYIPLFLEMHYDIYFYLYIFLAG